VNKADLDAYFEPVYRVLNRGIEQKIIKNVSMDILATFIFYPIITLANKRLCEDFSQNKDNIETAFILAWDAIKL
jgi:hypothetical protein